MNARRRSLLAAALLLSASAALHAQGWPAKPIRMVVPFAAGGPADSLARLLGAKMSADLGQQVLVDNKGGAGGTLGAADVARAAPDGYNVLFSSTGALVIFPVLSPSLPYDPEKDLVAVGHAVTSPMVIVVANSSPHRTLGDLVTYAKANPDKLNFASAGSGTTTQLGAELLKREAGVSMSHIPYRGAAPALTDLMGGQADLMVADLPAVLSFTQSGKLRPLALTWPTRSQALPNVPTTAELGWKNVVSSTWYGLMAPAKTPREVIDRLNASMNKALKDPETVAFLKAQGTEPAGGTPAEFAALVKSESVKWGTLAKAVGAKLD